MTDKAAREMTFEEEAKLYKEETAEFLKSETVDSEPPFVNSILRRGNRIIRKASDRIERLQSENTRLKAERDKAVEDLENLIDCHCACNYCANLMPDGACEAERKGACTCLPKWKGLEESE